jgi:hypothetical protein
MLLAHQRPCSAASLLDVATCSCSSSPWSWSPSPTAGSAPAPRPRPRPPTGRCGPRPATTAAPAGPRPRPGCPCQRLGRMLGLLTPHNDRVGRRLPVLPPITVADLASHRHPERRLGRAAGGVPQLGIVGQVAGKRHARLGHAVPPLCSWPGGAALPLERGHGGYRGMPKAARGKPRSERTRPARSRLPARGRSGAGLVRGAACGWRVGHAIYRPARSLHPGRGGRSRLTSREPLAARPRRRAGCGYRLARNR